MVLDTEQTPHIALFISAQTTTQPGPETPTFTVKFDRISPPPDKPRNKTKKKKSLKNFPGPVPLVVVGRAGGVTPDLVWDDATLAPSHITAGPGERLTHCFIFFKCHQYRLSSLRVGCRIKDDHHHHFENLPTVTKSFSSVYLVQVQDIILVLSKQIVIFRMPSVLISSSWRNPVIGRLEVIKMSPDQK